MKKIAILMMVLFVGFQLSTAKNIFTRRFIKLGGFGMCNKDIASVVDVMKRASKAGYNGALWDGSRIPTITHPNHLKCAEENLSRIRAEATKLNLHFMCYSHGQTEPTRNDENAAEAIPVINSPFKAVGQKAALSSDHSVSIFDGGFEAFEGNSHAKWRVVNATPGVNFFVDKSEFKEGATSIRFENPGKSTRFAQSISVKPGRAYELSMWMKTRDYSNRKEPGFYVLVGKRWLLNVRGGPFSKQISPTQEWRKYTIDFNSVDHDQILVIVYVSYHAAATGKIWFDNLGIREVGLYDRHEREGLPVLVESESGTAYQEGKDYNVGVEELTIPVGSAIQNGQKLNVTWYQKAEFLHVHPEASFCHAGSWDVAARNGTALNEIFGKPRGWFIKYSEWRLAGWDPNCKTAPYHYKSTAEYMGGTQKRTHDLLRGITNNCNLEAYVWTDAYDPYHNAKPQYYLINGPVNPSWKYLDPQTIMLNWREGKKYESVRFFAGLDSQYPGVFYRQMLSFWSQSPPDASGSWFDVLDKLEAEGMKDGSVVGMQYTTWTRRNYDNIERFANACQSVGRWGNGPVPWEPVDPSCNVSIEQGTTPPVRQGLAFSVSTISSRRMAIGYRLPERARVRLSATDTRGRTVAVLQDDELAQGKNSITWDVSNVAAGVYFLRLSVDTDATAPGWSTHAVRKMVVY